MLATLVAGPSASAQTAADGPWYTVELIVFEQLDSQGLFGERWPLDPGRPAVEEALVLSPPGGDRAAPSGTAPTAFELLGKEDLALRETWSRLRRSRGFRPLLHVAWRQPGYPRTEAPTARLSSAPPGSAPRPAPAPARTFGALGTLASVGPPPEKIDGVVRLYRSRYLHLEADLVYHRPEAATVTVEAAPDGSLAPPTPTLFRMVTSRRMRSRELHYLDHPLFGVIALVTPFELAAEEQGPPPEEPVTTPLPPQDPSPAS